jgi:hypothetical protein
MQTVCLTSRVNWPVCKLATPKVFPFVVPITFSPLANFFVCVGLGFQLRVLVFGKQALYPLEHSSSPFYSGYFLEMESWELFSWIGFKS